MKRAAKALVAVYFALFMCIFGGMTAFAVTWDIDHSWQLIRFDEDKVPEGTAFADILIKDKWHDKYAVDFNEENGEALGVDKDCGLAKYDKDGYTSLLLRHNCAMFDYSIQGNIFYSLIREKLYNRYRTVKVAYCDKDGNVLGVTDAVKVKLASHKNAVYSFDVEGESLSSSVSKAPELRLGISDVIIITILLVLIILIILRRIIKYTEKANTKRMIKRIRSGEDDNESGKQD